MLIVRLNFAQFCTEVESKEQGTRKDKEQGTESLPHNIKEEEQEGGGRTDYNFLLKFGIFLRRRSSPCSPTKQANYPLRLTNRQTNMSVLNYSLLR
jgi:hypothetical protein